MELASILLFFLPLCASLPSSPGATGPIVCPKDYIEYAGHCYRLATEQYNWTDARHICQREGGDLVFINSYEENTFLRNKIPDQYHDYWIGMQFRGGRYWWLDGHVVNINGWEHNPPHCKSFGHGGNESAIYLSYPYKFRWACGFDSSNMSFICEIDPNGPPVTPATGVSVPSQTGVSVAPQTDFQSAIHLECQHQGWYVTVDLNKLSPRPSDVSLIYMNKESCVGTLQESLLVFNKTYKECNTHAQISHNIVTLNNYIVYAIRDSNNVVRDLRWKEDLHCSHGYHTSGTVNIKPDITQQGSSSGQIPGSPVDIKLYTDSAFSQPLQGTVKLGTPVYVQVLSLSQSDVSMVVDSCEAYVNTSSPNSQKPHPLIQQHCSVDSNTLILAARDQVTRFRFDMFNLPNDHDGIYVTCNVVFCDPMDFSSQCEQICKTGPPLVGTPLLGTPPVGTPPVDTPPVSTPPVGTPPVDTPPVSTSPIGTSPVGTPHVGTSPVGTSPVGPPVIG